MPPLSPQGRRTLESLARRHGFGPEAAAVLLHAVAAGGGAMAQFSHPELGGTGQWMRGGMSMIGDMFNTALKARVEALCADLARLAAEEADQARHAAAPPAPRPHAGAAEGGGSARFAAARWWPDELGLPDAAGAQNDMRYAYFSGPRRLALEAGGALTVLDTLDHRIGGVFQQQSSRGSLVFTSQHGPVDVASLPVVSAPREAGTARAAPPAGTTPPPPRAESARSSVPSASEALGDGTDPLDTIERLADLHGRGILTDDEFSSKKAELLGRL